MKSILGAVLALVAMQSPALARDLQAGAARVAITPKLGVPLGGYGGGARRRRRPDLNPFNDHALLNPSQGTRDPLYARALVLVSGEARVCILTIDAIAIEGELVKRAVSAARKEGFSLPLDSVLACASHTHSGSGAVTGSRLWQLTAMDLLRREVRARLVARLARVLVEAEKKLAPAVLGVATSELRGATRNRRAKLGPGVSREDIDPQLGVIRIDHADGRPLATVWNFAVHGTMHGAENLRFSADVMGLVNAELEGALGGEVLFINGAEGDISPAGGPAAAAKISAAVIKLRAAMRPERAIALESRCKMLDLGRPRLSLDGSLLGQLGDDPLGIGRLMKDRELTLPLRKAWVESVVRLQVLRLGSALICAVPGEPIAALGARIRAAVRDSAKAETVLIAGLANNHVGYLLTEEEHARGGYEAAVSFFGRKSGARIAAALAELAGGG